MIFNLAMLSVEKENKACGIIEDKIFWKTNKKSYKWYKLKYKANTCKLYSFSDYSSKTTNKFISG